MSALRRLWLGLVVACFVGATPPAQAQTPGDEASESALNSPMSVAEQREEGSRAEAPSDAPTSGDPAMEGAGTQDAPEPGPSAEELETMRRMRIDLERAGRLAGAGSMFDARLLWIRVARELPGSLESIRASLLLADDALERRDPVVAKRWLDRAVMPQLPEGVLAGVASLSKLVEQRRALKRRLAAWPHDPERAPPEVTSIPEGFSVGVLLPLSGPYKRFGQMSKQGLDLALEGASITVRVADTRGEAERARAEARRLIVDEGVSLLIGPIGREETRAAAEISQEYGVAMISLSSFPGALHQISTAIRIRFSPGDHARAVARRAVAEMGLKRLAVVYPESRYGLEALDAFWAEARRLGASLSVVHALGKDVQTEKARRRQELVGVAETSKSALAASNQLAQVHALESESSRPYDALFLPLTRAVKIRELVRVLEGRGVPIRTHPSVLEMEGRSTVQLLGLYGFNRSSIIDMGDRLTENAIFAVGFAHDPDQLDNHQFVNAYLKRYGAKPGPHGEYAAAAHDAALLAIEMNKTVASGPGATRERCLEAIRSLRHVRGALGDRTLRPDGRLSGRPTLLTVEKNDIRVRLPEVEEAAIRARPQKRRKR